MHKRRRAEEKTKSASNKPGVFPKQSWPNAGRRSKSSNVESLSQQGKCLARAFQSQKASILGISCKASLSVSLPFFHRIKGSKLKLRHSIAPSAYTRCWLGQRFGNQRVQVKSIGFSGWRAMRAHCTIKLALNLISSCNCSCPLTNTTVRADRCSGEKYSINWIVKLSLTVDNPFFRDLSVNKQAS